MLLRSTLICSTALSLAPVAFAQAPSATKADNQASNELQFTIGGVTVRRVTEGGVERAMMSPDGGSTWRSLERPDDRLRFRLAEFDPIAAPMQLPGVFAAPEGTQLFVVQFHTHLLAQYRDAVEGLGAEILHFLPAASLYVRCDAGTVDALRGLSCVRWVGPLQNGFKLDDDMRKFVQSDQGAREINLVLAKKADRNQLIEEIDQIGGTVTHRAEGSTFLSASLTPNQLADALSLNTVVWADAASGTEYDMDNARVQGGGNYVETMGGYRGEGIRVEIAESFEQGHPDFTNLPNRVIPRTTGNSSHGHCTAGIIGGAGTGNASARGMMDECTLIEGGYGGAGNHYSMIQGSAGAPYNTMQITSSWGSARTFFYTSVSQSMDDALFDFDIVRTQSQSNAGNQDSRPEAWAKNSFSVGGVRHGNNANPGDDNWTFGASIGPAQDGRLKPDICAYYDQILTSDRSGGSGLLGLELLLELRRHVGCDADRQRPRRHHPGDVHRRPVWQ